MRRNLDNSISFQQGTHNQLLQEDGLYKTLVSRQLLGHDDVHKNQSGALIRAEDSNSSLRLLDSKEK